MEQQHSSFQDLRAAIRGATALILELSPDALDHAELLLAEVERGLREGIPAPSSLAAEVRSCMRLAEAANQYWEALRALTTTDVSASPPRHEYLA